MWCDFEISPRWGETTQSSRLSPSGPRYKLESRCTSKWNRIRGRKLVRRKRQWRLWLRKWRVVRQHNKLQLQSEEKSGGDWYWQYLMMLKTFILVLDFPPNSYSNWLILIYQLKLNIFHDEIIHIFGPTFSYYPCRLRSRLRILHSIHRFVFLFLPSHRCWVLFYPFLLHKSQLLAFLVFLFLISRIPKDW